MEREATRDASDYYDMELYRPRVWQRDYWMQGDWKACLGASAVYLLTFVPMFVHGIVTGGF